jgi:Flp pilus assembly protein TadD
MRNRGTLHARKGDYDSAIPDYSDAARLDPDDPHALIGRALVYCAQREFANAIQDFDAALRICPACPFGVTGRASASSGKECR